MTEALRIEGVQFATPGAFTANGPLSPDRIVELLLAMVAAGSRRGYRHILDGFWDEARSYGVALPTDQPVSGAAFCTARYKLPPEVIRTLVHRVADAFDRHFGSRCRWFGRRVFGVDGSDFNVRRSDHLRKAFGVPSEAHCPQILVSTLFDLRSKLPHDVSIAPFASCEREQMMLLLARVKPGDVLVLDRGYPSFEVLCKLADAGIDFVVRVPLTNTFQAVEDFLQSGGDDYRVLIAPPRGSVMKDHAPLEVRAIRAKQRGVGLTVLLTSLRQSEFSRGKIAALYRERWEIEEYYKLVKSDYFGQGQFHAMKEAGIRQEVHAVALFVAIARYLMAAASKRHRLAYDSLSPKSATLGLAAYVVRLLVESDKGRVAHVLDQILKRIVRTRDRKRPGRRCPRRSFQPTKKWGPGGRRGR
jgi:Transposase DDE domain